LAESRATGCGRWDCPDDKHEYGDYGKYGDDSPTHIDALADLDGDYGSYYPIVGSSGRTTHRQIFGKAKKANGQGQIISLAPGDHRLRIFSDPQPVVFPILN
jgi:hypothetical protein